MDGMAFCATAALANDGAEATLLQAPELQRAAVTANRINPNAPRGTCSPLQTSGSNP